MIDEVTAAGNLDVQPNYSIYYEILANSSFIFMLTGSRFFGYAKSESDWDYYAEDKPEIEEFLIDSGFTKGKVSGHNLTKIYHSPDKKIEVQLVPDFNMAVAMHNVMLRWGHIQKFNKYQQFLLWGLLESVFAYNPDAQKAEVSRCQYD